MTLYDQWINQAEYDLETAGAMLRTERYLYVLFCCQQAIEKALKAVITTKGPDNFPPKIHQLPRLAELTGLSFSEKQLDFMGEATTFYIQARYPDQIKEMSLSVTRQEAEEVHKETVALLQWLQSSQQ
jgi:HEPN domain-containing protein